MFNATAIKAYRHAKKMRQQEAAKALGISAQWLCRIELGHAKPSANLVEKLAALYGTSAKDFVAGEESDHEAILRRMCNAEEAEQNDKGKPAGKQN